jgi:5-methyltetrahydropteroyltriglutamate--homocysteine methyltransferase
MQAIASYQAHKIARDVLDDAYSEALRDTIERFKQTGSPVLTDGEQTKPSFPTES